MSHVVVVGGGQAAASLVRRLRGQGFEGRISVFCDEPIAPYERPPLSKKFLLDEAAVGEMHFGLINLADSGIDLILSTPVTSVDPLAQTISVGGKLVAYDHLVLATGAAPRRLPLSMTKGLAGNFVLRSVVDAMALRSALVPGGRLLVVGGGYIGLEVAATAVQRGMTVTVVEMGERILNRVASPAVSDAIRDLHRSKGVDLREGAALSELDGDTHIQWATLNDGSVLDVDSVVVGIGAQPNAGLAQAAGLTIDNGIWTDTYGRTSAPSIWAAGDCASFPYRGEQIRLESVQNAIDQAETVADNILGAERPYMPVPSFWSEQYDTLIQIVGLSSHRVASVDRPGAKERARSFWHYGPEALESVEVIDDPKTFALARRMIADGKSPVPDALGDMATNLKALLRA